MGRKNNSYPQEKRNYKFEDQEEFNNSYYYKKQKEKRKKQRNKDKATKYQSRYEPK